MKGFISAPPSGGLLDRDRLELRGEHVVDGEGHQVREGADAEQDGVPRGDVAPRREAVEERSGEDGEEEAAGRSPHPPAAANMPVLRARLPLQPFRIRYPGSQPPAMLSTVTIV